MALFWDNNFGNTPCQIQNTYNIEIQDTRIILLNNSCFLNINTYT